MKAFILAAGLGTRLRPLTEHTPKCLVEIAGVPLLEWWFRLMKRHGVHEFLINTHHLAERVESFVNVVSPAYELAARIAYEPELIGSAGTLRQNWDFVEGEGSFFVLYADNLTNADLTALKDFHTASRATLTMALYRMERPETRGIAEVDATGRVLSFEEKPKQPKSDLANGGIYVMSPDIGPHLTDAFDIGYDVIPRVTAGLYGKEMGGYLRDIGNLESLAAANAEWPAVAEQGR